MTEEIQRTGYNINITNFQLEQLQKLAEDIHNCVFYKHTANMMKLVIDLKQLIRDIK